MIFISTYVGCIFPAKTASDFPTAIIKHRLLLCELKGALEFITEMLCVMRIRSVKSMKVIRINGES
jgi:hypothetical protein